MRSCQWPCYRPAVAPTAQSQRPEATVPDSPAAWLFGVAITAGAVAVGGVAAAAAAVSAAVAVAPVVTVAAVVAAAVKVGAESAIEAAVAAAPVVAFAADPWPAEAALAMLDVADVVAHQYATHYRPTRQI